MTAPPPSRALSIVHVLSSLGMGGGERIALDLARGQAAAGHRVLTVSLAAEAGALRPEFDRHGLEVAVLPKRGATGLDLVLPFELGALFGRRRADVVHTHNILPLIYAVAPARLRGAAVVHTKHGKNLGGSAGRERLGRAAARGVGAFVAVSDATAAAARAARECPPDRLRVITNGIDLSRFAPDPAARAEVRAALGVPDDGFLIGTVGRLVPVKDHPLLLRAVAPLLGERVHLAIVGDGPERADLDARIAALPRPGSVHLLGNRPDVPRLLAAMDVFVLSSASEGLPLVIPEAMATGLPVVSTDVGGIADVVVAGETGTLVRHGDEAALRAALAALDADRSLGRRLGASGRARALSRYSSETMGAAYLDLYRALIR